ncbi:MAG TPA: hypothetical protein VG409_17695, partial [Actinomycetota bacterium]|nr:hypothetical protein [Actinomycetota bacterium]
PELYLQCVAAAYQQRQRLAASPGGAVDNAERAVSGSAPLPLRGAEPGERAGEGARPSPVEQQGGFAPPG